MPIRSSTLLGRLECAKDAFGRGARESKLELLRALDRRRLDRAPQVLRLHEALCFLRAYPDDARVLGAVESLVGHPASWFRTFDFEADSPLFENEGLPGSVIRYDFSLPLLRRMQRRFPGCFEIDWDELQDPNPLADALGLFVTSPECQGLDDISLDLSDWFAAARPDRFDTDLEFLVSLFTNGPLDDAARDLFYESCGIPVRFELADPGTARSELRWHVERVHYQKQALDRKRRTLASAARRPFARARTLSARQSEKMIALAQGALCARGLEIRTLRYANMDDVSLADCGRGLQIALIGVIPRYRDPLESHYCGLILKNGIPIAYGPGTVSLGCCEIGLNLFPEFRGAEVRFIYPQFVRTLHQLLGANYFFLTPYGMGRDNPAAIRTGAFWFYRKLGFRPTNPDVEELALQEEERMRANPRYRSNRAMLRRLSHTSVFFDLSGGAHRPLDLGAIGLLQSRFIAGIHGGDRRRAVKTCVSRVARVLGKKGVTRLAPERRRAWEILAPLLAMIPDLERWGARDKKRLLRILHEKGGAAERGVNRLVCAHARLCEALRDL